MTRTIDSEILQEDYKRVVALACELESALETFSNDAAVSDKRVARAAVGPNEELLKSLHRYFDNTVSHELTRMAKGEKFEAYMRDFVPRHERVENEEVARAVREIDAHPETVFEMSEEPEPEEPGMAP